MPKRRWQIIWEEVRHSLWCWTRGKLARRDMNEHIAPALESPDAFMRIINGVVTEYPVTETNIIALAYLYGEMAKRGIRLSEVGQALKEKYPERWDEINDGVKRSLTEDKNNSRE